MVFQGKVRGRRTGSTSIDPNDRRTPKKTTKPTTIGSASNSINKYFGSKVVKAIEQPSKSVARSLDMVSMNLDVQSLSIMDDIVKIRISFYLEFLILTTERSLPFQLSASHLQYLSLSYHLRLSTRMRK